MGTCSILQYGLPHQMGTSTDVFHGLHTLTPPSENWMKIFCNMKIISEAKSQIIVGK